MVDKAYAIVLLTFDVSLPDRFLELTAVRYSRQVSVQNEMAASGFVDRLRGPVKLERMLLGETRRKKSEAPMAGTRLRMQFACMTAKRLTEDEDVILTTEPSCACAVLEADLRYACG